MMGKVLSGELSCPCDRSCFFYVMGKGLSSELSCTEKVFIVFISVLGLALKGKNLLP